jgi:HSP20 family protein
MAEPTQQNSSNPSPEKANAGSNAGSNPSGAGQTAHPASSDSYNFGDQGEVRRSSEQTGVAQAGQAGRQLAQSARRGGQEVADLWRASLEPFALMSMDVNRLFEDLWRQATGMAAMPALRAARPFAVQGAAPLFGQPATDAKETDQAYLLTVELPGLKREDIDLQLRNEAILISGHKAEEKDTAGSTYRISERRFGRFERSFPIPPDVDREHIAAEFKDGVLKVTLPKSQEAGQQNVKIDVH